MSALVGEEEWLDETREEKEEGAAEKNGQVG
jgi:hypothetical protein